MILSEQNPRSVALQLSEPIMAVDNANLISILLLYIIYIYVFIYKNESSQNFLLFSVLELDVLRQDVLESVQSQSSEPKEGTGSLQ